MKGVLTGMLCLLLVSGCQDKAPKGVLTKDQMVEWMIAIYLAEARIGSLPIPRDSSFKLFLPYQDSLKIKKGVPDSTWVKSYQYYLEHPVELEAIYDTVIDSLNLREQRLRDGKPDPAQ